MKEKTEKIIFFYQRYIFQLLLPTAMGNIFNKLRTKERQKFLGFFCFAFVLLLEELLSRYLFFLS